MTSAPDTVQNPFRLPTTVLPRAYRLELQPNLEAATFAGSVEIDVDVQASTTSITLNSIELEIDGAVLRRGDQQWSSGSALLDEEFETATFHFDEVVAPGPATLQISFRGILNDQLRGFYRSTFVDADGESHTIATTQMAPTDARRAFPCWDDPAVKATFQVTLVVAKDLAAFSNTREIESVDRGDGTRAVRFAESMIMSTYLVAFAVGAFDVSNVTPVAGTDLRVIVPKGQGHLAAWATEVAVHALDFFTDYFAIPYPGDKIDFIAIPDFAAGAMENLGLVTFRETDLLIDPATASHAELARVALVVNHELAHMWFGDLVTMEWWNGIWLNEAFATFMEALCTDHFRPEWQKWVSFNTMRESAFTVDSQHSTRPIEYSVVSPAECRDMFDVLTYIKGCSVLRMLEQYLGATTFRDGIRSYLRRHAYGNAVTHDLWQSLEEASGVPVSDIMNTWILQGGFPLVHVDGASVTQSPFSFRRAVGKSAIGDEWKIPLMVRSLDSGTITKELLDASRADLKVNGPAFVNGGGVGFFRTAYSSSTLNDIAARLGDLESLERAVLISDTWSSLLLGKSTFSDVFALADGLKDFDEPVAWSIIFRAFGMVDRIVDEAGREALAGVVEKTCRPVFSRLGWEPAAGESTQTGELRAGILRALGTQGRDPSIIAEASRRFDVNEVHGDLADAIVAITMAQGRAGDAATCEARRESALTPQEARRYLFAPVGSGESSAVLSALDRAFTEVRSQDAPHLIGALMSSRIAGEVVWRAVTPRLDEALAKFPAQGISGMFAGITTFVSSVDFASEVRSFHESHPLHPGQQQVAQLLDVMDVHVELATRTRESLVGEMTSFCER